MRRALQVKPGVRQTEMGVTIHFAGRLRNEDAFNRVVEMSQSMADEFGWSWTAIAKAKTSLARVRGEEDWNYVGPTRGLTINPHESCEPLHLEFDQDLYLQEFVKTQFAPVDIHVRVVELLRRIEPEFEELQVDDEGDYWTTIDEGVLGDHRHAFVEALEAALRDSPNANGPVRLPNGRIADLIEQE